MSTFTFSFVYNLTPLDRNCVVRAEMMAREKSIAPLQS